MANKSTGNCYICGANLGKTAMINHLFKVHKEEGRQECCLLKIEGADDKNYWLYIDVPMEKTLSAVDVFLRKIWLECCGHLSEFYVINRVSRYHRPDRNQIEGNLKMETFDKGEKFFHDYDFGTTTETVITVAGRTRRKPQKDPVRVLARNVLPDYTCADCGKPAAYICQECIYQTDNPFFCEKCIKGHEHEMRLPVTNSPRIGECGYGGEHDVYKFIPAEI